MTHPRAAPPLAPPTKSITSSEMGYCDVGSKLHSICLNRLGRGGEGETNLGSPGLHNKIK